MPTGDSGVACVLIGALLVLSPLAAVEALPVLQGRRLLADWQVRCGTVDIPVMAIDTVAPRPSGLARMLDAGPLTVMVTAPGREFAHPVLLPRRPGAAAVRGREGITVTVPGPGLWTLCLDDDPDRALHLDVRVGTSGRGSRPELTFGPGEHEIDTIELHDGDRLWLDPRAVLRPRPPPATEATVVAQDWAQRPVWRPVIMAKDARRVEILGGGVIDASGLPWHARMVAVFWNCSEVVVDGVTILDAPTWGVALFRCTDATLRGVRNLSHRENSDGIDLCNSARVLVEDCFFRTNDDAVCVKTTEAAPAPMAEDIRVRRVTVWNERARALGITSETRHDIARVSFEDCDIIRDRSAGGECAALAVLVADRGTVSGISFRDIHIEHVRDTLALLRVGRDAWSKDDQRGRIAGVTFTGLDLAAGVPPLFRCEGFDDQHRISGVAIRGLTAGGRPLAPVVQANPWVDAPIIDAATPRP